MPLRAKEIELTVDRPLGLAPGAGSVRLTARFAVEGNEPPRPGELAEALERLKGDLEALVGPPIAGVPALREDRPLSELVETYHPRQRELLDLLRAEGELTPSEHGLLLEYLASGGTSVVASAAVPDDERLIAALPVDRPIKPAEALPSGGARAPERPVEELLRVYQIGNLRQAGAVRARRQISFGEYMALKRHFERTDVPPSR